ncbi:MAG: shikimate kinase [Lentisphaeria bacterium]|jgi:shikimate kinase
MAPPPPSQRPIFLIGLPGVGKSTIARHLAKLVGLPCHSLDEALGTHVGATPRDYFQTQGETAFRQAETAVLARLAAAGAAVIDCGGGVVKTPANLEIMRRTGHVVWLRATVETMLQRLRSSHARVALGDSATAEKVSALLASREPLYHQAATLIIATDGKTPAATAAEIRRALRGDRRHRVPGHRARE